MSRERIVILKDHELYLTYTWHGENHGICGHTFEVIDYFLLLKNHFKVAIILQEDLDHKTFDRAIREKYDLSEQTIDEIHHNTLYHKRPTLLRGSNILVTDGSMQALSNCTLLFDNVFLFGCYDRNVTKVNKPNWFPLLDHRVYGNHGINYVKKINFNSLRVPDKMTHKTLIYATEGARDLEPEYVQELVSNYPHEEFLLVCYKTHKFENIDHVTTIQPPVPNLVEAFDKYLYTKTVFRSDCSPRFVAECKYFGKDVEFYDIDYFDQDLGLYYRMKDLGDLDKISLDENDEIINILKEKIC